MKIVETKYMEYLNRKLKKANHFHDEMKGRGMTVDDGVYLSLDAYRWMMSKLNE